MKKIIIFSIVLFSLTACTSNQRARSLGGNATEKLPVGQKLIIATWKQDNLWLLYRPMREGDVAETYKFQESSSFGLLNGTVTIIESK